MIKCFKIQSGEELIGEVAMDTATQIVMKNPAAVTMIMPQNQNQGMQIALIPVAVKSKDNLITIERNTIVFSYEPEMDFVQNYRQMFSPIKVPAGAGQLISPTGQPVESSRQSVQDQPASLLIENPNEDVSASIVDDWKQETEKD